jgi:NitT/TauT family transport system permease protein
MTASVVRARTGGRRVARSWSGLRRALPPALTVVGLVAAWQAIVQGLGVEEYVFPSPAAVAGALADNAGSLWQNAAVTLLESLYGFALGSVAGTALGILFAYSRPLERAVLPLVVASNAIPVIAVAPILLLVLGEGMASKVAVTAFLCFFPVCVNAMKGLRTTPVLYVELMHVNAATAWQAFRKVRMPASLPYLFVGLKVGATFAVIGAIVAEFVAVQKGLGAVMVQSNYQLKTPALFAATLVAALLGLAFYLAVALAERLVIPWNRSTL